MIGRFARLVLLLFSLAHVAATCQGTETGNPGVPSDNPGGGTGGETSCLVVSKKQTAGSDIVVDDLLSALCNKIILCGVATTTDTCFNALNGPDGDRMTDELGLVEETFTIAELRAALIAGELSANTSAVSSCETAIGSVDCAEVGANVSAGDFSGTENFIPDACFAVFASADAGSDLDPSVECP